MCLYVSNENDEFLKKYKPDYVHTFYKILEYDKRGRDRNLSTVYPRTPFQRHLITERIQEVPIYRDIELLISQRGVSVTRRKRIDGGALHLFDKNRLQEYINRWTSHSGGYEPECIQNIFFCPAVKVVHKDVIAIGTGTFDCNESAVAVYKYYINDYDWSIILDKIKRFNENKFMYH